MKLQDLAARPRLIEISLDDADTLAEYGEALTFWTWDRQPMSTFMRMATVTSQDTGSLIDSVRELILDENGTRIITDDVSLPTPVMLRVIARVVDSLGKSPTSTLNPTAQT